jgi:hypothetical protein
MPVAVAYLSGNTLNFQGGVYKKGTVGFNLSTSLQGNYNWWNPVDQDPNKLLIYSDTYSTNATSEANAVPSAWATTDLTDQSLLNLINSVPELINQPKFTDVDAAVDWLQSRGIYFLVKNGYENITTNGLILNLDGAWYDSFRAVSLCGQVAENQTLSLTAPTNYTFRSVDFASYGTPVGTCGTYYRGYCHAASSQSIAESAFLGNSGTVSILASNAVFTDPCQGVGKPLAVQVTATENSWYDVGGTGETVTLFNGPGITTRYGGGVTFDGTDDYGRLSTSFMNGATEGAFEFWFETTSVSAGGSYYFLRNCLIGKAGASDDGLGFSTTDSKMRLRLSSYNLDSVGEMSLNTVYHVVGTWNSSTVELYIDGILNNSAAQSNLTFNASAFNTAIGRNYFANAGASFSGTIYIGRVYNKKLTADEVYKNYTTLKYRFGGGDYVKSGLVTSLNARNSLSYPGSGSSWIDVSGNGKNGTLENGTSFNSVGFFEFDGSDDDVNLGTTNSLYTGSNLTWDMVFLADTTSGYRPLFANAGIGSYAYIACHLSLNSMSVRFEAANDTGYPNGNWFDVSPGVTYTVNQWGRLTITYDGSIFRFYKNGVQAATYSWPHGLGNNTQTFYLGRFWAGTFNGNMSIFNTYNRTLSASEVLTNYYGGNIVTNGLCLYLDADNLVSFASGASTWKDLAQGIEYTLNGWSASSKGGARTLLHSESVTTDTAYIRSTNTMDNTTTYPKYLFNNGNITFEIWTYATAYPTDGAQSNGSAFSTNSDGSFAGNQLQLNHLYDTYSTRDISGNKIIGPSHPLNVWTQNVICIGANTGTPVYTYYRNGQLYQVMDVGTATWGTQTSNAYHYLMRDVDDLNNFAGHVAIIRMYNRQLNSQEVIQNFNANKNRFYL